MIRAPASSRFETTCCSVERDRRRIGHVQRPELAGEGDLRQIIAGLAGLFAQARPLGAQHQADGTAIGQVQPCGYLDLDCGQVREKPFPEIWRTSRQFLQFRNKDDYEGKCGVCQYHRVCGGCRARAQTMSGNYMAPEPLCDYTPPKAEPGAPE